MTRSRMTSSSPRATIAVLAATLLLFASPASSTTPPNVIASNEAAAVSTLRRIAAIQSVFKRAQHMDTDCDGVGEYGYFAEMAGTQPMRVATWSPSGSCVPAAGGPGDLLFPPLLRGAFGSVSASCVVDQGYVFAMWLAAESVGGRVWAHREDPYGGKLGAPFPDPVNSARYWCCYAWPLAYGQTGRRAFFVNQRGKVMRCSNRSTTPFTATAHLPWFDEAFLVPGDMSSPIRFGIPGGSAGSIWSAVP